jgi:hypothetical protein
MKICSAFNKCVDVNTLINLDRCITDNENSITVDLANLQMLVIDTLPCEIMKISLFIALQVQERTSRN